MDSSTRTRCAFEVAAQDLGMGSTYLGPTGSQIGVKESIADTARVLGRMYDELKRGDTGEMDENGRFGYSAELAQQRLLENYRQRRTARA